jgi:ribosomal protein L19
VLGGFIRLPLLAQKRGLAVEDILPIVKVQDRVAAMGGIVIARRQVHNDITVVRKMTRMEVGVELEITGQRMQEKIDK